MRAGRLLLVRRAIDPWQGCWDIPGGFCDGREHPVDTVVREVHEETGLRVEVLGLLGMWIDDYRAGSAGQPADVTLNCYYHARPIDDRSPVVDRAELSEAAWFAPDDLPRDIAFPDHAGQVLAAWRDALASPGGDAA